MNKMGLVNAIAAETGMTKKSAGVVLDAMLEAIGTALGEGETVRLVGFGTFEVRTRVSRMGRNPRTKELIRVPETKSPVFRPSAIMKSAIVDK